MKYLDAKKCYVILSEMFGFVFSRDSNDLEIWRSIFKTIDVLEIGVFRYLWISRTLNIFWRNITRWEFSRRDYFANFRCHPTLERHVRQKFVFRLTYVQIIFNFSHRNTYSMCRCLRNEQMVRILTVSIVLILDEDERLGFIFLETIRFTWTR